MFKINIPDVSLHDLFDKCIETYTGDSQKKRRIKRNACNVQHEQNQYDILAQNSNLYTIDKDRFINHDINLFRWIYKARLLDKKCPGRELYDKILLCSDSICPYCGHGQTSTLDHYLPKENFPEFSISPCNLIPCCPNCNSKKLSYHAAFEKNQLIHPYYDDMQISQWLYACIHTEPRFLVCFIHKNSPYMSHTENARSKKHFELFDLAKKYAVLATQELSGNKYMFKKIFESGGQSALKLHLNQTAESYKSYYLNYWKHALYQTLNTSEWFVSEGFLQI